MNSGVGVVITGGLGAGKTVFVKGMCEGLDVTDNVLSPTFILLEQFDGRLPVVHIDLFRLDHEDELEALGVFDFAENVVLIAEWGERSPRLDEDADVVVTIENIAEQSRRITIATTEDLAPLVTGLEAC